MAEELWFQGAESKIFITEVEGKKMLVKERFPKTYRNPVLDAELTKKRMNAEYRNITRCQKHGIKTPEIYKMDLKTRKIFMEYLETSKTVKQVINELELKNSTEELKTLAGRIGEIIHKLHSIQMIHGDLTSSNILITDGTEVTLIDFGLSSVTSTAEDKAVDLYVLERALLSTHATGETFFQNILEAYKKQGGVNSEPVLQKFEEVRARGRKRTMVG